ncbi:MAG: hypothetical protein OEQ39_26785, partial [Gammaproteobacteria bacterium]|nr:hypothetical protein [Gammaproteobacteria bacterium]
MLDRLQSSRAPRRLLAGRAPVLDCLVGDQSIQATRSLTFQLSSAVLQELGLVAALQQLVEWFNAESNDTHFVFASGDHEK